MANGIDLSICPICKSKAELLDRAINTEGFDCPNPKHGKFRVALTVLKVPDYVNSDVERWEAALKKAKDRAKPGELPCIQSYDFSSASSRSDAR